MRTAKATLHSMTPYSQSAPIEEKKPRDESHDEFEKRTWMQRCHVDEKGICYIPPMAFKKSLSEAAKYKGIKIPGSGNSKYTKHFEAGVMCVDPVSLGVHIDNVEHERVFVPSDGRRGGTSRVWKQFPVFREWTVEVTYLILDEIITDDVFAEHLKDSGQFIGIGRWRPRNDGMYGRFEVLDLEITKNKE